MGFCRTAFACRAWGPGSYFSGCCTEVVRMKRKHGVDVTENAYMCIHLDMGWVWKAWLLLGTRQVPDAVGFSEL